MATYKVLGQLNPAAVTLSSLLTVPLAMQDVVSTLAVCNVGTSATTFRVAVRPAGEALNAKHYVIYNAQILASDSLFFTLGLTLAPTDVVSVYAGNAMLSFNLFGSESAV